MKFPALSTGGAVITVPPTNQTKLEGEKVQFSCEAKALPGNVTVRWFREGAPVTEVSALDTRVSIKTDGSLVINPVSADDSGQYLCEVTNGIGDPQSASAYLNVECEFPRVAYRSGQRLFGKQKLSSLTQRVGSDKPHDYESYYRLSIIYTETRCRNYFGIGDSAG